MNQTIQVPSGWHEITLLQWMNLVAIKGTDTSAIAERIAILSGLEISDVLRLESQSFERLALSLGWIGEPIPTEFKEELEIDGINYNLVTDVSTLELGCFIDIENFIEQSATDNLHLILACLYRKDGKYDGPDFELAEKLLEQPITAINGASVFFSRIAKNCVTIIDQYLDRQNPTMMMN